MIRIDIVSRITTRFFCQLFAACFILAVSTPAADSVRIMDDGDAGFAVADPSAWQKSSLLGYGSDYLSTLGTAGGAASWTFSVNPGEYRVYMTWYNAGAPFNSYYSTAAPVTVSAAGTPLLSTSINERTTPNDLTDQGAGWKLLGTVNIAGGPLVVSLSPVASLYVIADAVRIERTDGKAITSPTVSDTVPANSPLMGGIPVTIHGSQFTAGMRVLFGSKPSSGVTVISSTEMQAIAPANSAGVVDITAIAPDGTTGLLPSRFKYAIGRTLDDGEPGFTASTGASSVSQLGFQSHYVLPGGKLSATASWTIPVNGTSSQAVAVTWPNSGAPYNSVNSKNARFDVIDGTTVLASIPANMQTTPADFTDLGVGWKRLGNFVFRSGNAKVVLRNDTDTYVLADAIRVEELAAAAGPVLNSCSPASGPVGGGTVVTVTGTGFASGATVNFGSTAATGVTFISSTSLKATTPAFSASGPVSITVRNPDGQSTTLLNGFTILPTVTVTATDAVAGEPATGQGQGAFTFKRTGTTTGALTVNFTCSGTATSGSDYAALGSSITFAAGSATAVAALNVLDDTLIEPNETVVVTIASGTGYTTGAPVSATVTIQDDDLPIISVVAADASAGEPGTGLGGGTFTFSRTGPTASALNVNFTTSGTATSGVDFRALGTTISFAAGSATASATVTVIDDTLAESRETVNVTIAPGSGYVIGASSSASISISDDDTAPVETALVTSFTAGVSANSFNGWMGTRLHTGSNSLEVTALGRVFRTGNIQNHELRIINPANGAVVASATWTPSGGLNNQIKYVALSSPVTLAANSDYILASYEESGKDSWYHYNTVVTTTGAAAITSATYSSNGTAWSNCGGANNAIGPVSLKYKDMNPALAPQSLRAVSNPGSGSPILKLSKTDGGIILSWQVSGTEASLQTAAELDGTAQWKRVDAVAADANGERTVTLPTAGNSGFYRLIAK